MPKYVSFGMNVSELRNGTNCNVDFWHENSNIFNFKIDFPLLENHIHHIFKTLWWANRAKQAKRVKQAKRAKRAKQTKQAKQAKRAKQVKQAMV